MPEQRSYHAAHVRVRRFNRGDAILAIEIEGQPHLNNIEETNLWYHADDDPDKHTMTVDPIVPGWLDVSMVSEEGDSLVFVSALDNLYAIEIHPLFIGCSYADPSPMKQDSHLHHVLKHGDFPQGLATTSSMYDILRCADICRTKGAQGVVPDDHQGVWFLGAFAVFHEDDGYSGVRFEGILDPADASDC